MHYSCYALYRIILVVRSNILIRNDKYFLRESMMMTDNKDYRVDCCNENCAWSGLVSECHSEDFIHDSCPECSFFCYPVDE